MCEQKKGKKNMKINKRKSYVNVCVCVCMLGSVVHVLFIYFVAHLHWTQYKMSENSLQ